MADNDEFMLKRISELEQLVHKANEESKKRKILNRKLTAEMEELRKAHEESRREIEETRSRPADEWQSKYEAIRREVWKRDHKDAWNANLNGKLVDGVPLEEIWAKIGYEPSEQMPTPERIAEQLEQARQTAPYLFRPVQTGSTSGRAPTPTPPAGGQSEGRARLSVPMDLSRGGRTSGPTELVITKSQLQDPNFFRNNRKAIIEAQKNNALVVTGE